MLGKKGFTLTQSSRTAYVLQLQTLLLEADPTANDLEDGDSGIDGRSVKRKAKTAGTKGGVKKKGKKRKSDEDDDVIYYMDYSWTTEEEESFTVDAIVGKVVADGKSKYANQGKAAKGEILYRIVWKDYPPDLVWYEPAENLGSELLSEYEERVVKEAEEDEASAKEDEELEELEELEAMPA